jgi:hypothetical protein
VAFDYTLPADVFAFGNSAGTATSPVNEATVMASLVTAMSRALDAYCNQYLSLTTYTQQILRALVDQDGVLTCYPAVPTMSIPTAADFRVTPSSGWTALATSNLDVEIDIEEGKAGCVLRVLNTNYAVYRGRRMQMRISYAGGWADLASVPKDFEWATRALCWWAYQKRSATADKTAIPDLGVLVIPGNWPGYIRDMFRNYVRQVVM